MSLDMPRFADLSGQVYRLICVASLMLASPTVGADLSEQVAHKKKLIQRITIILDLANNDM